VDLFAGPGGWDEGARGLGLRTVGVEWDSAACRTAQAAGHQRVRADVSQLAPAPFAGRVRGLIASPPCTAFTVAGLGHGRADLDVLTGAVAAVWDGTLDPAQAGAGDQGQLALQPVLWAAALQPEWIALEQVREVAPLWQAVALVLRRHGYSTWTACVDAADYGVPQNRRRAVLLASRTRTVHAPAATHAADPQPDLFGDGPLPWCSADSTPCTPAGSVLRSNYGSGGDPAARTERPTCRPALTVTSKVGRNYLLHPDGTRHRVTVEQAAAWQTFPPGYPWAGGMTSAYEQLGNAVPPLLAQHLLGAVT
jgi:DNA (cytosine-5)-methyltransferase 1